MVTIRSETPFDVKAREALLDAAFGEDRRAKTCERLREGRRPAEGLALVASEGRRVVGTIRFWSVDCGGVPALMLGPVAVAGDKRSAGIGAALIREGLAIARARGHAAVMLVGDAPYYARFGFSGEFTRGLDLPGPVDRNRFLALELVPGAMAGADGMVVATGERVGRRRDGLTETRRAA